MVSKKPKLLWISDWLLINSGYGIQTAGILNGLKKMFTVYHLGLQFHGQPFVLNDIWQIPNGKDAWCNDKMKERIDQIKPDYIVTLMDLFRPCNWLQEQDKYLKQKGAKTIAYFPLDGEPVPFSTVYPVNRWEQFDYLVPMSHYGRRTLLNELPELKDKVTEPIWHGINTSVFKPIPKKDNEFYKQNEKVLKGKFVVSSVFRNINRKNPMALIYAWKKFSKDKKDICLVLHTNPNEFPPTNLAKLVTNFNLNDSVMFTARDEFYFSHPPDFVNWIYNASQVHVLGSTGEGFGIPIIEAMAAGKPNILTDYSTSDELINFGKEEKVDFLKFVEGGCLIPYKHYPTNCHELTRRGFIEWEILADAFEWYYQTWKKDPNELERKYKDVCRNHALQHFDWNTILPQWKQLFEKILKENGQVQKS